MEHHRRLLVCFVGCNRLVTDECSDDPLTLRIPETTHIILNIAIYNSFSIYFFFLFYFIILFYFYYYFFNLIIIHQQRKVKKQT